ncbi:peptidase family C50-domain-containing protein [Chlamydoabsidia padenii]|nr:peptidase family C50-domain-containing protein [Chlamydoabsidia padenii]
MEIEEDDRRPLSRIPERTRSHLMNLRHAYQQEHDLDDAEFQTYFIDILPCHWTVCSLSIDVDLQEMVVAQYRAGEPPLVVKLPLNRADERRRRRYPNGANCDISYEQAFNEFEDIIQLSDETIHSNKSTLLKKDIEDWWMTRSLLDTRMKKLLEQMERSWIGGFKGLFSSRYHIYDKGVDSFRQSLKNILTESVYGSSSSSTNNTRVLDVNDRILHMILRLGPNPSDQEVEDIVYFLLVCFESHEITIDYSDAIIDRTVQQVRQAIVDYHTQAKLAGINTSERLPKEHIILIPDKHTQQFPLESLPSLRSQSVSRLPCISFLRDRILYGQQISPDTWQDIQIDASRTYFVLNPSGDLKYTQAKFETLFSRMHTWEGVAQKKPSELECRSVLMQKDLYM